MADIKSGASSDLWTIDPISKAGRLSLYDAAGNPMFFPEDAQPAAPHGLMCMGLNDEMVLPMRLDRFGSQAQASHMPMLVEQFEGATINPNRWNIIATTMAAAQSTVAGLTFNSGNITTLNTGYLLRSVRSFMRNLRQPLHAKFRARLAHVNNSVFEIGFGDAATFNGANTTGAYWQVTAAGALIPVLTFNGVDLTGVDARPLVNNANFYTFDIFMDDDEATFIIQETGTGQIIDKQTIKLPITAPTLLSTTQVGFFARAYNTGTAPASASVMILSSAYVAQLDGLLNAPVGHIQSLQGRGGEANPLTGAQLAQWANSAAPASATLSNTAAGYGTLGGLFQFAAPAGAVTDFALFGFQVPAPATLVVTGVSIDTWNTGAISATSPTLLNWALAANSAAVSLATATANRKPLGAQSIPVGAAIGAMADRSINRQFDSPIIVGPGRFLHLVLRVPVGAATASQVIAGMASIDGYFI